VDEVLRAHELDRRDLPRPDQVVKVRALGDDPSERDVDERRMLDSTGRQRPPCRTSTVEAAAPQSATVTLTSIACLVADRLRRRYRSAILCPSSSAVNAPCTNDRSGAMVRELRYFGAKLCAGCWPSRGRSNGHKWALASL
jgi:hypothetical protein